MGQISDLTQCILGQKKICSSGIIWYTRCMTNRYSSPCHYCKAIVIAGEGNLWSWKGRWYTAHKACSEERKATKRSNIRIEFPSRGATYCNEVYGVYEYGVYDSSSVLAGQEKRTWLDEFNTLEEAKSKYPSASVSESTGYRKLEMTSTPPSWFDPAIAGEEW